MIMLAPLKTTMAKIPNVAPELQPTYVQLEGRADYTAVLRRPSDGQDVWSCEHITHEGRDDAIECATRELNRRTPKKGFGERFRLKEDKVRPISAERCDRRPALILEVRRE